MLLASLSLLQPESFAVITQDLGRMCRYVKQGEVVPSALLGSAMYKILRDSLQNQAVFHGPFVMPSNDNGHVHGTKGTKIVPRYVVRSSADFNLYVKNYLKVLRHSGYLCCELFNRKRRHPT